MIYINEGEDGYLICYYNFILFRPCDGSKTKAYSCPLVMIMEELAYV